MNALHLRLRLLPLAANLCWLALRGIAADGQWRMIEPGSGGAFFAAGVGPTGIALVAADLSGGYISYDEGHSWQNRGVPHGVAFGTHTSVVGFDSQDEAVIYLGGLGVLYKSSDRGATFQPIVAEDWDPVKRSGTFRVIRDPTAIERHRLAQDARARFYWTAIAFTATDPKLGYAAVHLGYDSLQAIVLKTTDRGETWRTVGVLDEDTRIAKILIDPRNADVVYLLSQPDAFTGGKDPSQIGPQSNVRKSRDGGRTWRVLAGDTEVTYRDVRRRVARLEADGHRSRDPDSGAPAIYDGTRAPASFTEPVLLRDVLDVALDPANPDILYLTKGARGARGRIAGEGTYRTTDGGAHWTQTDKLFGALAVIAVGGDASRTIVRRFDIGGWEGSALPTNRKYPQVWESTDGGRTWALKADHTKFSFGAIDPHWYGAASAYAKTIATSPATPDIYYWIDSQWVYKSDDGGASFHSAGSTATIRDDGPKWYATTGVSNVVSLTLKISEADPNFILTGSCDIGLWRSLDRGRTWQHANEPGFLSDWVYYGGQAQAIALDPERPNVAWAGLGAAYVDQILVKSEGAGKLGTWRNSHRGLPLEKRKASYQEGAALRGLSVDRTSPRDRRTLFVVADDKVARSTDDGANWEIVFDLTGGHAFNYNELKAGARAPDRQAATAIDPTDGRFVYAGGADGLFRSTRGGARGTWERIGPPEARDIHKIAVSCTHPERVYVAAFGSGLFRSTDRGATWQKLLDDRFVRGVAVHPQDDRVVFAASCNVFKSGGAPRSRGALLSVDGGATWREVNEGLAWPFVRDVEFNPRDPAEVFIVTPGTSFHVRRFAFEP